MKIELMLDKNCLSRKAFIEMANRLAQEFSKDEIKVTSFENDRQRLMDLRINLLPVWLVNGEVLRLRPDDYQNLKKEINARK